MKSLLEAAKVLENAGVKCVIDSAFDDVLIAQIDCGDRVEVCRGGNVESDDPTKHYSKHTKKTLLEKWALENRIGGPTSAAVKVDHELRVLELMHNENCTRKEALEIIEFE